MAGRLPQAPRRGSGETTRVAHVQAVGGMVVNRMVPNMQAVLVHWAGVSGVRGQTGAHCANVKALAFG